MSVFNSSKMSTLSVSGWDVDSCDVRIDGDSILVAYRDGAAQIFYRGQENGPGHFELSKKMATARLHFISSPGEIYWKAGGLRTAS